MGRFVPRREVPQSGGPRAGADPARPGMTARRAIRRTTSPPARSARRKKDSVRRFDARPDTLDFRDQMYQPTLVEVPERIPLEAYRKVGVPVLDQGEEGACTGFGLATIVHYLLRTRRVDPSRVTVSARMLYHMARRYDEWPGEKYEGSSARGAMKGWHKHGVCRDALWPHRAGDAQCALSGEHAQDAIRRPLGAYFRVNHKDLVAMHAALAEVNVLYATALVHDGWMKASRTGAIPYSGTKQLGGHAFAIVAYDGIGFWIQNSWGRRWGKGGFGRISYDDWLENALDVWVARLAVPIELEARRSAAAGVSPGAERATGYSYADLRPHVISIGNDGRLRDAGTYATNAAAVREIVERDIPNVTRSWKRRRILLWAHGGLVGEQGALQRLAEYRTQMLPHEVYPLAFVWRTDYWTTLTNILEDARRRRRPEGPLDAAKDFLLDRADDLLEPVGRALTGHAQWSELKENALLATRSAEGGARLVAELLAKRIASGGRYELHLLAHSAGSVFQAPLVQLLETGASADGAYTAPPVKIATCTFMAPAITTKLFRQLVLPAIRGGSVERFTLVTLTDSAERDDHCANIYHKSLLYLVSNAFEDTPRIPILRPDGEPLLGMEKFVRKDAAIRALFAGKKHEWVLAPNDADAGSTLASRAKRHGDFDDDESTVRAVLARILGRGTVKSEFGFTRTGSSTKGRRKEMVEK